MFENLKSKIHYALNGEKQPAKKTKTPFCNSLNENMITLRKLFPDSMDLNNRTLTVGQTTIEIISCEGMINAERLAHAAIEPLTEFLYQKNRSSAEVRDFIMSKSAMSPEQKEIFTFEELFQFIMSGFVAFLIDGESVGFVIGMQGFNFRSISEPTYEANELGGKEAFV